MRLLLVFFGLTAGAGWAQNVQDAIRLGQVINSVSSVPLSIGAVQGDGSTCKLTKIAGPTILAVANCASGDGKTTASPTILQATGTVQSLPLAISDVLCLLVTNPTSAPVTVGSFGAVPTNGIAWQCTTNIRTSGAITGQTPIVAGSVVWP